MIPPDTDMCNVNVSLSLREMQNATTNQLELVLQHCLGQVDILDMSANLGIANLTMMRSAVEDFVVVLPLSWDDSDGNLNVPVLQVPG